MVTLEQIQPSLFSNLYDSFLVDDDPLSDEQDWRNVFDYQWQHEEGHCGYALLDDAGEAVGMIGMVFSERQIDGATHKLCNLHTWWVREDHRGRSLMLLRPLLKLEGYTITHFTPCDKVRALSKRLGFDEISVQLRVLLPWGASPRRWDDAEEALTYDLDEIAKRLTESDRRIFDDHQPYGCGHVLVRDGDATCYLLYTVVVRHRLPYVHIHYISNRDLFAECETTIRSSLLRRHKVRFVALDARLVQDMKFPASFDFWAPANGLYKSDSLRPEQIDNLYSDIVFLKLTCLPDMSHELRQIARRWWPCRRMSSL